jgi:hypothetical protein
VKPSCHTELMLCLAARFLFVYSREIHLSFHDDMFIHYLPKALRRLSLVGLGLLGAASLHAQTFDQVQAIDERLANGSVVTRSTAPDAAGNIIVAGYFEGTVMFGSFTLNGPMTAFAPDPNVFVAKLSPSGQWLWAVRGGGGGALYSNTKSSMSLALDANGDAYLAGAFQGTGTFGPAAAGGAALAVQSAGGTDGFVARLDGSTGAWRWVARSGGVAAAEVEATTALALDGAGHVFVSGQAEGGATFGSTAAAGTLPALAGTTQALFLARLDAATGAWQWASRAAEGSRASSNALVYDGISNLYLAGSYNGTAAAPARFGPALSGTAISLQSAGGSSDALVACLDAATGQFRWAVRGGSSSTDVARTLAVDAAAGRLYVGGSFLGGNTVGMYPPVAHPAATFDSGTGTADLTVNSLSGASAEPFVAQLETASGRWRWLSPASNVSITELALGTGGALFVGGGLGGTATFRNPNGAAGGPVVQTGGISAFVARLDAATGTWGWVAADANPGYSNGNALRLDAQGRPCLAGTYQGRMSLGTAGSFSLAGSGPFVSRFDPSTGAPQLLAGGEAGEYKDVSSLATDATGNVYVAGTFSGKITLGTTTLYADGVESDAFVAKRTRAGQWLWADRISSSTYEQRPKLVADQQGHLYVTGRTGGQSVVAATARVTTFVGATGPALTLSASRPTAFVARLDAGTGQWQWVSRGGNLGADAEGSSLAVDAAGVPYVTGTFGSFGGSQAAVFEPAVGGTPLTLTGVSLTDVFVGRLRPADGLWQWVARAGAPGVNYSGAVAVDGNGRVFVSGSISGGRVTATFEGATGATISSPNGTNANSHAFVGALDAATGAWTWVARTTIGVGGAYGSGTYGMAVTTDAANHVWLAGTYRSALNGDNLVLGQLTLPGVGVGANNLFAARLDAATGAWQWATHGATSSSYADVAGIVVDQQGHAYLAGRYERIASGPTVSFISPAATGVAPLVVNSASSPTYYASYVARLSANTGAWEAVTALGCATTTEGIAAMALDGQNNLYVGGSFVERAKSFGPVAVANGGRNYTTGFVARIGNATTFLATTKDQPEAPFAAYPSPVAPGQPLHFQTTTLLPAGSVVEVYSVLGQRVGRWPAAGAGTLVVPAPRTPGVYIFRLRTPTTEQTTRVIVQE